MFSSGIIKWLPPAIIFNDRLTIYLYGIVSKDIFHQVLPDTIRLIFAEYLQSAEKDTVLFNRFTEE